MKSGYVVSIFSRSTYNSEQSFHLENPDLAIKLTPKPVPAISALSSQEERQQDEDRHCDDDPLPGCPPLSEGRAEKL